MASIPGSTDGRVAAAEQTSGFPWDRFENRQPLGTESDYPAIIVGAGLAGCWLARTLAEDGYRAVLLEAGAQAASGASKNPAGIVKPFVTRSPGLAMQFYVQAHQHLLDRLGAWNLQKASAYVECGVVQLVENSYPESSHYRNLCPDQVSAEAGVAVDAHGLLFEQAGWLNPAALCQALLQHENIQLRTECSVLSIDSETNAEIRSAAGAPTHWRVHCSGEVVLQTTHLTLCSGVALNDFTQSEHLKVPPARGQLSRFALNGSASAPNRVINGRHYVIPDAQSLIVGATFDRGNDCDKVIPEDNAINRQGLSDMLAELPSSRLLSKSVSNYADINTSKNAVQAYAGVRATTPDRLPLVGPLPDAGECERVYADLHHGRKLSEYPALPVHPGLYVLGGLGSRGIVTSPLAASLLANHMTGGDKLAEWAPLLNPARFQIRTLKRLRPGA